MKTKLLTFGYQQVARPILWQLDPEFVHDHISSIGHALGKTASTRAITRSFLDFEDSRLAQTIAGITFRNPIGLAAGFDKSGGLVQILPDVGFGFAEIGSITWGAYAGNPAPRLTRLKQSQSIVVNYGLASQGAEAVAARLEQAKPRIPIGISIAPTNAPNVDTLDAMVTDMAKTYQRFAQIGAYTTLNLSCPNTHVDQPFMQPAWLKVLLKTMTTIRTSKPIFVKLSPDRSTDEIIALLKVADAFPVAGVIASNLTKVRTNERIIDSVVPALGGLSGRVVAPLTNQLIRTVRQNFSDRFVIIGCGGVFSIEDVIEKFRCGASLIQLATGMIFEGPQLISSLNRSLIARMDQEGVGSLAELRKRY